MCLWLAAAGPAAAQRVGDVPVRRVNDVDMAAVKEVRFDPVLTVTNGLFLRLAADRIEGLDDDDGMAQWNDHSGQGNHAVQADANRQPLFKTGILNGRPVARFDGATDHMRVTYSGTMTGVSMFAMTRILSLAGSTPDAANRVYIAAFAQAGATWHTTEFKSTAGKWRGRTWDGGNRWVEGAAVTNQQWKLLSLRAANSDKVEFWEQGAHQGGTAIGTLTMGHNIIALGANGAPAGFLNGDIAEILVYNRALPDNERETVERYLGEKWLGW